MKTAGLATILVLACGLGAGADPAPPPQPADEVHPMDGTDTTGHTYPGAVYPFGLVQLSPDTGVTGWEHCSGYHYPDKTIIGFSHTHLTGTGCTDLGDILFQPTTGSVKWTEGDPNVPRSGYRSAFSHADEQASPGYYKVMLHDYGVKVELTATPHAGFHRYTFPAGAKAHVMIDLVHGIDSKPYEAMLTVENPTTISGYRRSHGWAQDKTFYFVAEFSRPFDAATLQAHDQIVADAKEAKDAHVRGCLDFSTAKNAPVLVRIGISPTSVDEARKNLAAEITTWDFDGVCASTKKAWNDQLSTIDITTHDPALRRTIYTALYHSMLAPHLYNNVDGSYEGPDHQAHEATFANYCTFSIWDQFRAWFPLMTIIQPGRIDDQMNTFLNFYQQENQHSLPVWTLAGNETWCMIGYNSVVQIATAQRDGFHGFDAEQLFAAMKDSALDPRRGQQQFHQSGYVFEDKPTWQPEYWQAVSQTLEFAYDDYCIAQMAKALGHPDDAATFLKYAANYRNVFDPETKFMRGRKADGSWHTPFNPITIDHMEYTEADAWQYSFTVPQDAQGLITLMGGDDAFCDKLDAMFAADSHMINFQLDITGLVGQYAQGNEPVHAYAYMYAYAGQPWREPPHLRKIMSLYYDAPDGICGNDDCGQMSAWYVLGALGFYPVNPVSGQYILGSPLVDQAVIHLDPKFYPGGTFTITAQNNSPENTYIQSATLNGQPLNRAWITHEEITHGGMLVLQMAPTPNKAWGSAPSDRPSSMTPVTATASN